MEIRNNISLFSPIKMKNEKKIIELCLNSKNKNKVLTASESTRIEISKEGCLTLDSKEKMETTRKTLKSIFTEKTDLDASNLQAKRFYAWMCYDGLGGSKDLVSARSCFKDIADRITGGWYKINVPVYSIEDVQISYSKKTSTDNIENKKNKGLVNILEIIDAPIAYSFMCQYGLGGEKNLAEVRSNFKVMADFLRDPFYQFSYAMMCYTAEGGRKDLVSAKIYFEQSAVKGNSAAQYAYGVMLYWGEEGEINLTKARQYFKLSADQGNSDAQYTYAMMCYEGIKGKKSLANARKYFNLAADQGDAQAQYKYALMCQAGEGGEKNDTAAKKYFELAASRGYQSVSIESKRIEFPVTKVLKRKY